MTDQPTCAACGRALTYGLVLVGWHACQCGGHATRYCRADRDGCGHTSHDPPLEPVRCQEPVIHTPPR